MWLRHRSGMACCPHLRVMESPQLSIVWSGIPGCLGAAVPWPVEEGPVTGLKSVSQHQTTWRHTTWRQSAVKSWVTGSVSSLYIFFVLLFFFFSCCVYEYVQCASSCGSRKVVSHVVVFWWPRHVQALCLSKCVKKSAWIGQVSRLVPLIC